MTSGRPPSSPTGSPCSTRAASRRRAPSRSWRALRRTRTWRASSTRSALRWSGCDDPRAARRGADRLQGVHRVGDRGGNGHADRPERGHRNGAPARAGRLAHPLGSAPPRRDRRLSRVHGHHRAGAAARPGRSARPRRRQRRGDVPLARVLRQLRDRHATARRGAARDPHAGRPRAPPRAAARLQQRVHGPQGRLARPARRLPAAAAQRPRHRARPRRARPRRRRDRRDRPLHDRRRDRRVRPGGPRGRAPLLPRLRGGALVAQGPARRRRRGAPETRGAHLRARDDRDERPREAAPRSGGRRRRRFPRRRSRGTRRRAHRGTRPPHRRAHRRAPRAGGDLARRGAGGGGAARHRRRAQAARRATAAGRRRAGADHSLAGRARLHDPAAGHRRASRDRRALPLQLAAYRAEHGGGPLRHPARDPRFRRGARPSTPGAAAADRAAPRLARHPRRRPDRRGHRRGHRHAGGADRRGRVRAAHPHRHPARRPGPHPGGGRARGAARSPRAGAVRAARPRRRAARLAPVSVRLRSAQGRGVLVATVLGSGVAFLDSTVVNVALPVLGRELHAGIAGLQWTMDAYLLTLTALLLLGGSLGDAFGRRKIFVAGLVWFALASAACGLAPSIGALAVARAVQGAGAALLVPGSLAVLRSSFAEEEQGRAVGAWAGLSGVTAAVGPLVGGWLITAWSWRVIFFLNLPLAAAAAWAALRCIPESRTTGLRVDVPGALAATLGLGGCVYALIEARHPDPMLPLDLFRSRQFSGANAVTLAVYFALSGATFLLIIHLQSVLGYSPLAAGAALTPVTLLLLVLSPPAGKLASRIGYRALMTAGPLIAAAGLALLAGAGRGSSYVGGVLPGIAVLGLGLATTVAPLTTAVLAGAEERHAGVAAAVNTAISRLAGLLAVALLPLLPGISAAEAASLAAGFPRAMWICAAVCAAGGLCALATLRT